MYAVHHTSYVLHCMEAAVVDVCRASYVLCAPLHGGGGRGCMPCIIRPICSIAWRRRSWMYAVHHTSYVLHCMEAAVVDVCRASYVLFAPLHGGGGRGCMPCIIRPMCSIAWRRRSWMYAVHHTSYLLHCMEAAVVDVCRASYVLCAPLHGGGGRGC